MAKKTELKFEKLQKDVIKWAGDKGIFEKSDAFHQIIKMGEEVLEYYDAEYKQDKKAIIDAIGDIQVYFIIYAHFLNKSDYVAELYNDRVSGDKMIGVIIINELKNFIINPFSPLDIQFEYTVLAIKELAALNGVNELECLESAYKR